MIYINARFLTQPLTGVQRFSIELCLELNNIRNDLIFLVPSVDAVLDKSLLNKINVQEIKGGTGYFWEQITLPKFLKYKNNPLLLNLGNTAPILYKNKIFTHHDVTYIHFPESYSLKFRFFYKILTFLNFKNSLHNLTVSEYSKQDIMRFYNVSYERISVIYNGVNNDFIVNSNENNSRAFALAVSSINYHKNFHGLLGAFRLSNIDIDLKIVGSYSNIFENGNISNQFDSRIQFLGRVNDSELIELYQKADFFIFPSLYEGFGIPPLEAQACGCPVISSNAASLPEILGDSAYYFDPKDILSIKSALEAVNSDEKIKENLKRKGFDNVSRFSWKISAQNLNKLLINLSDSLK